MSQGRKQQYNHSRYRKECHGKSVFDGKPTLIINRYHTPNGYYEAVQNVITAYKSGTPFNKAVDQVYSIDPNHLNRNKLAEHTLKTIANDY